MTTRTEVLEIHLERLGEHSSWLKKLLLGGGDFYGTAQVRFVARPPGEDHGPADHVLGATFPVMELQNLDDRHEPNAWLELAEERLAELDRELTGSGWVPLPAVGDHWWSRTYTRRLPDTPGQP